MAVVVRIMKDSNWKKRKNGLFPGKGRLITTRITRTDNTLDAVAYELPYSNIQDLAFDLNGGGADIKFTNADPDKIAAGTAVYSTWDQVSLINKAVTGFVIVWGSGTANIDVSIRLR